MNLTKILLASTSPYRRRQLERLGFSFEVTAPLLNEESHKNEFSSPMAMSIGLAKLKALSLKRPYPDHLIIAGDQTLDFQGKALGKPHTHEKAVEQLLALSGSTHTLWSAACVLFQGKVIELNIPSKMTMHQMNRQQIEAYLNVDQPYDCAGSYKIEAGGIRLFKQIETSDFSAIEGMGLLSLNQTIKSLGI